MAQVTLEPARLQHILYGDATGGGHMHGSADPTKTKFPADWDSIRIRDEVLHAAVGRRERCVADLGPYKNLEFALAALLSNLSASWAGRDIAYVRDLAAHAEYGEALENLIALGAQSGKTFSAGQRRQIERMASMMKMDGAALLAGAQPGPPQLEAKLG